MMISYGRLAGCLTAALLTACGALPTTSTRPDPAPVVSGTVQRTPAPSAPAPAPPAAPAPSGADEPAPVPPEVAAPPPAAPPRPPAVLALLDSADRQERAGRLESSAATLERALRVNPRDALIWHRLARVRLAQKQWQAAANLAAKSNSLAGANVDLQKRNWTLIAEARARMGDSAGARAARANAAR